jgi:hypothetical protein
VMKLQTSIFIQIFLLTLVFLWAIIKSIVLHISLQSCVFASLFTTDILFIMYHTLKFKMIVNLFSTNTAMILTHMITFNYFIFSNDYQCRCNV